MSTLCVLLVTTPFVAADVLSAVQFDHTGEYLATGDRGGRVVIFRKNNGGRPKVGRTASISRACLILQPRGPAPEL